MAYLVFLEPSTPVVSMSISVVLRDAKKFWVNTDFGGSLTVVDIGTGLVWAVCKVLLEICLLHFFTSWKLLPWANDSIQIFLTLPLCASCAVTFRTAFNSFSVTMLLAVKSAKRWPSILSFAKVYSVSHCAIHNRGTIRAYSHFSRSASGKVLNVIEYFVYLLNDRRCFWVFIHDGMTFWVQRC